MPHYDYKCKDCGYSFEIFQKMTEEALKVCPSCKGSLKRLIGKGAGPIFKGSGFYQTDYKNSGIKKDTTGKKDSGKEAAGKGDTTKNDQGNKTDSSAAPPKKNTSD